VFKLRKSIESGKIQEINICQVVKDSRSDKRYLNSAEVWLLSVQDQDATEIVLQYMSSRERL